jgi:catechol 2,3-dioxygenase-like lactoylglutathione lyase family enzyme
MADPDGGKTAWFKDSEDNIIALTSSPQDQRPTSLGAMLAASDLARAKAWYAEKLGFEPMFELEGVVVGYQSGNSTFSVYQTDFAGTAKNTVAVWRLKGIVDEVARLRERGVVFEDYDFGDGDVTVAGILSDQDGPVNAWLTDSEGNILAIAEDR